MIFKEDIFKGKITLITGGTRGGMLYETAKQILLHGGEGLAIVGRNEVTVDEAARKLQEETKRPVLGVKGNIRKQESCEEIVEQVLKKFGRIDYLINGAAGNFLVQSEALSENGFKTVLEIDTLGTFLMSKVVFLKEFQKKGQGVILNFTANLHYNGTAMQIHSSAAKAGVDSITKSLAVEWGPYNVRVIGICPGIIEGTVGFNKLSNVSSVNDKAKAESSKIPEEEMKEFMKLTLPLHRLGTPRDIANAVLFALSPAASYMTGNILLVDGGQTLTAPNFPMFNPEFMKLWKAPMMAKL